MLAIELNSVTVTFIPPSHSIPFSGEIVGVSAKFQTIDIVRVPLLFYKSKFTE